MPRKPKANHLKQKNVIPLRVTDTEQRMLSQAAIKARLPVATYSRLAAISKAISDLALI